MKIDRINNLQSSYTETVAAYSKIKLAHHEVSIENKAVDNKKVNAYLYTNLEDKNQKLDKQNKQDINYDTIKKLNKEINSNLKFEYDIDDDTNRVIIKVKERESDKLLCEIPPEKVLKLAAFFREYVSLKIDKRG